MGDVTPFLVSTLNEQVLPKITDQIYQRCVAWGWMKRKKVIAYNKGGKQIEFRVRNAASALGGATNDWLQRNPATSNPFTSLTTPWTQYSFALLSSAFQEKRNKNASDKSRMFDQAAEQIKEMYQSAVTRFGNYIYGDGTALDAADLAVPFDGLRKLLPYTYNTLYGIDRSVAANAWFRPRRGAVTNPTFDDDGDGVTNLIAGMQTLWNTCCTGGLQTGNGINDTLATEGKEMPYGTITTQTIYEQYERSLMGQYMYVDDSDGAKDPIKKLAFASRPIDWDPFCPAGYLWMLNFDYLHLWTTESEDSLLSVYDESKRGTVKELTIGSQVQMWCDKPSASGVMTVA